LKLNKEFIDSLNEYFSNFGKEIDYLKQQFNELRIEAIRKDHQLVKFLQIAYDQEMYLNEIRRVVISNDMVKAESIFRKIKTVKIGSLVGLDSEYTFDISRRLEKGKIEILGTKSGVHDVNKVAKRIQHQLGIDRVALGMGLDSQYISRERKKEKEKRQLQKQASNEKARVSKDMEFELLSGMYKNLIGEREEQDGKIKQLEEQIVKIKEEQKREIKKMTEEVQKKELAVEQKISAVKKWYECLVGDLKLELEISNKINERLENYNQRMKKELVFAKLILKSPKSIRKVDTLMNF
jgi:hypothetical protein